MSLFRSRSASRADAPAARSGSADVDGLDKAQTREAQRLAAILGDNAQDLKVRRALAELYQRAGKTGPAIREYQALAGAYAAQGLLFRAIATCKSILALDATHDETHRTLANLYAQHDQQSERALVELPASMGAALVVDPTPGDVGERASEQTAGPPPPPPEVSAEGEPFDIPPDDADDPYNANAKDDADDGAIEVLPDDDDGEASEASLDLDGDDDDIVDAGTLAALTVRPEGSVTLQRPASVPLFSGLSPQTFELLVKELKAWEAEPGAVIVAEGEDGDSLFVVARGRVRVERQGAAHEAAVVIGHVEEGGFFGEIAIVAQRPRSASVVAEETTELLEISRATLGELCTLDRNVRAVLDAFCSERLKNGVLMSSPVFEGLSPAMLSAVAAGFEERLLEAGVVVVAQGLPSPGLFVVLTGSVDVTARLSADGTGGAALGSMRLKVLQPGDVFGEMSLLSGDPASASVTTSQPTRLLALPASSFSSLSETPELRQRIQALSSSRAAFNARFLPATDVARPGSV